MKFYNREKEKQFLENVTKRKNKKMIVMYGRRRVGKTTLLQKFFPDAEYFFVDTRSSETLLADFSKRIFKGTFENWEGFFNYLLKNRKTVILDEFQNFTRVDNSIFSILQKVWDQYDGGTVLILCGSYSGMMKRIFFDAKEPLFGRSDYQIRVKPFDFISASKMLFDFGYSIEETIEWYSILGGVPKYLWYLKDKKNFAEKTKELFFSDFAPFEEEGKNLLIGEFGSEHSGYFSVLQALGDKNRFLKEITDRSNMQRTKTMKYINELTNNYDIIEKIDNMLSKRKRGAMYKIKDNFLRFWFRYIYSQKSILEFNPDAAYDYFLRNQPATTGILFEDIITSLIPQLFKKGVIPFLPTKVGKHWGNIPGKKGKTYEIDIAGENETSILLIECKWENSPVTIKTARKLIEKSQLINDKRKKTLAIVSKSGFEKNIPKSIIKIDLKSLNKIIQP